MQVTVGVPAFFLERDLFRSHPRSQPQDAGVHYKEALKAHLEENYRVAHVEDVGSHTSSDKTACLNHAVEAARLVADGPALPSTGRYWFAVRGCVLLLRPKKKNQGLAKRDGV